MSLGSLIQFLPRLSGRGPVICLLLAMQAGLTGVATQARAADSDRYRLQPQDVIQVDVPARADLSGQHTVDSSGNIVLPLVGTVRAAGRTREELETDLTRRLSIVDRTVSRVQVTLIEARSERILVLGSVLVPGTYMFPEMPTVWEAITQAGGPSDDALLSAVEVIPSDAAVGQMRTVVDVAAAIREGRLGSLQRLRPGDTVRVPRAAAEAGSNAIVYVLGAVGKQGVHPYAQARDLVNAVLQSGGPAPDANLREVEIVRVNGTGTVRLRVNMRDYFEKGDPSGNLELQPGDAVYLSRSTPGHRSLFSVLGYLSPLLGLATTVAVLVR